jgi:uncharacterized protein YggE
MTETFSKLLPGLILGALLTFPTLAKAADPDKMTRHISVSASATVSAQPDIAMISTGVVSEADTAREALTQNTAAMKRLIDGLKGAGIDAKDIQTVSFNVEPRYEQSGSYEKKRRSPGIIGYRVTNQVRITSRDIAKLGQVLDETVSLGANQIGGIEFVVSKAETLKDDARRAAVENARRRATLFAAAAGVELGEVISISENVQSVGPRGPVMARMAADSVPIEGGSQALEASVQITWALK